MLGKFKNKQMTNRKVFQNVCDAIAKVSNGEMGVDDGKTIAHLAKQANNALRYEIDRANTLLKLGESKAEGLFRDIEADR